MDIPLQVDIAIDHKRSNNYREHLKYNEQAETGMVQKIRTHPKITKRSSSPSHRLTNTRAYRRNASATVASRVKKADAIYIPGPLFSGFTKFADGQDAKMLYGGMRQTMMKILYGY